MKLKAVRQASGLTEGAIYYGQIIWKTEERNGKVQGVLKIVVYNDKGNWSAYHPSSFAPVKG